MTVALATVALSTALSAALTPLVRRLARRGGFVDHALTSRKIHRTPVPRLGGIAIVGAFLATAAAALLVSPAVRAAVLHDVLRSSALLVGAAVIAALGVWDDVRGARARHKLLVQVSVAMMAWALGFRIDQIANPFGPALDLGVFGLPFTVLWITGVVNAMNLIDGLDGLAAGVALIAASTTLVVAALAGQVLLVVVSAALVGAVLGFLFYNFNPASIFMGDSGSMFLGFVLATTAIQAYQKSTATVALVVPVIALALPIGDTLLAMGRRAIRGVPLFGADREHVHHRLLALGLSHRQAVLALYAASLALASAALVLARAPGTTTAVAVVLVVAGAIAVGLVRLGYVRLSDPSAVLDVRKQNLELRSQIRGIGRALQRSAEPAEIWHHLKGAAPVLGADCVALSLSRSSHARCTCVSYAHGFDEAGAGCLRASYSIRGERPGDGTIELGWTDGRATVSRDIEIAVEQLCRYVAAAVERVDLEGAASMPAPIQHVRRSASAGGRT